MKKNIFLLLAALFILSSCVEVVERNNGNLPQNTKDGQIWKKSEVVREFALCVEYSSGSRQNKYILLEDGTTFSLYIPGSWEPGAGKKLPTDVIFAEEGDIVEYAEDYSDREELQYVFRPLIKKEKIIIKK